MIGKHGHTKPRAWLQARHAAPRAEQTQQVATLLTLAVLSLTALLMCETTQMVSASLRKRLTTASRAWLSSRTPEGQGIHQPCRQAGSGAW
jgi:hypothetical protein